MGPQFQDPSVPAAGLRPAEAAEASAAQARVEFPAELLRDDPPPATTPLKDLKKIESRKIGQDSASEPGLGGAFAATALVLALLLGAFLLLRKFLGRSRLFAPSAAMRVLARRPLAPRQEVILVEIGSRVLVVGATKESLSRLGEVTGAEEIAALRTRCGAAPAEAAPARASRPPAEEPAPAAAYEGVLEELTKIRTTVRDWSRQEAAL